MLVVLAWAPEQRLCRSAEASTAQCNPQNVTAIPMELPCFNGIPSFFHTAFSTSQFCEIQDTSTQDTGPPRESGTLTDRSGSRQDSLRSPAPPESASWQNPEASANTADDKSPKEGDATLSEEDKGKAAAEGPSRTGSQGGARTDGGAQGTGGPEVPQSPFEQWRAEGGSGSSAQKGQTKVILPALILYTNYISFHTSSCLIWDGMIVCVLLGVNAITPRHFHSCCVSSLCVCRAVLLLAVTMITCRCLDV